MDAYHIVKYYQDSLKLINTDIAYLKRNRKLVNSVDMGNIYNRLADTINPLLYNQKLFDAHDIHKQLVLEDHPDKDPNDFLKQDRSYSYSLTCYVPDTNDFLWFFRPTRDGESNVPFVASIGDHHVPDYSLIITKTYEYNDGFSGWTQKDYVRQATSKDLLKFLYRLNHFLHKFKGRVKKINRHFGRLKKNNSTALNHYVGIGTHTKIEK